MSWLCSEQVTHFVSLQGSAVAYVGNTTWDVIHTTKTKFLDNIVLGWPVHCIVSPIKWLNDKRWRCEFIARSSCFSANIYSVCLLLYSCYLSQMIMYVQVMKCFIIIMIFNVVMVLDNLTPIGSDIGSLKCWVSESFKSSMTAHYQDSPECSETQHTCCRNLYMHQSLYSRAISVISSLCIVWRLGLCLLF